MRNFAVIFALPLMLGGLLMPAFGQAELREGVAGFAPDYFAESNPPTALEMVQLLPGFQLKEGDASVRGYSGALGNVLIDGRPPASKEDTLATILQRIPRASVLRIELIRSGAAGFDMQGYPLLANVVRRTNDAPRGRLEAEDFYFGHSGLQSPRLAGEISLGSVQVLDLSAAINHSLSERDGGDGPRNRYTRTGAVISLTDAQALKWEDDWTLSGTYRQPLFGGKLRLNGLYKEARIFVNRFEVTTFPNTVISPGNTRDFTSSSEFGLQYQYPVWKDGEAELIAIRRGNDEHSAETAVSATTASATKSDETILRGALRQGIEDFKLEGGVESAINTLGNNLTYVQGGVPIPLPGAQVRISEWRSEFFGMATWAALPDVTLEAGLRYEMSNLKQQAFTTLRKDLFYLKPHLLASWKPSSGDELRVIYERRAGQLDFKNFIPSLNLNNATVTVGNAALVPDTMWHAETAWEHHFSAGSFVLTARHETIQNTVDHVPVISPSGVFDGIGNIGSGHRTEFQGDLLLPLDGFDIPGVTLQGTLTRRFSHVTDPTTLEKRFISQEYPIEGKFSLIGDVPAWQGRWGATLTHANMQVVNRFNEIKTDRIPETLDLFIEYKPAPRWLFRLSGKNVLDRQVLHDRDVYSGPHSPATFRYYEGHDSIVGAHVGINIQLNLGE